MILLNGRFVKDILEAHYKVINIDDKNMSMHTFSIDVHGSFYIFAYRVLFQIVLLFVNMPKSYLF